MPNVPLPLSEFLRRCPDDVEILSYTGWSKPCTYRCVRCGEEHTKKACNLVGNKALPTKNCLCDGWKGALSLKDFKKRIKHLPYVPIGYSNGSCRCQFECRTCGTVFDAVPSVVAKGRHRCPTCKDQEFAEEYIQRLAEEFPHIQLVGEYAGFRTPVLHRCDCGYEWMSKPFIGNSVVRKAGCKYCDYSSGGPRLKEVRFGNRIVQVQGYEDVALRYLESKGVNPRHLAVRKEEGVPTIRYTWRGELRAYWPDFYHKTRNRIVEVKSLFTLLSLDFDKTCAKALACMDAGYEFKLILASKDGVLRIPKHWYTMRLPALFGWIAKHHPKYRTLMHSLTRSNPFLDAQR